MDRLKKLIPTEEEKQTYAERHGDVINTALTAMIDTAIGFIIIIATTTAAAAWAALRLLELISVEKWEVLLEAVELAGDTAAVDSYAAQITIPVFVGCLSIGVIAFAVEMKMKGEYRNE